MKNAKIFSRHFVSSLLTQAWVFGMFFSITKQLTTTKVLQTLPLVATTAIIYSIIQLLGAMFISNKVALRFLFLIPTVSICSAGLILNNEDSMLFYAAGAALLLAGYANIMREKKIKQNHRGKWKLNNLN